MGRANGQWPPGTLMARLCERSRQELLSLGVAQKYRAGRVLMREGDEGDSVYLLRSWASDTDACVKITANGRDGVTLFAIRVSGDLIGELGALEADSVRSSTATTCTDTIAHCIPGAVFLSFLHKSPDGWQALCRTIVDRLAWADQRRLDFADCPVRVRLARVLLELVETHGCRVNGGWRITVQLSQRELGDLIGASEDAVGLAMGQLREPGVVSSSYRQVVVHDLEALRHIADIC